MPFVRSVTVMGELVLDAERVIPPFVEPHVAVYPVIGLPLSLFGENDTVISAVPAVAAVSDGAAGTVDGVTPSEAGEGALVPTALLAVTVQVYVSPLKRFGTVIGEPGPVAAWLTPLLDEVHVAV